MAELGSKIGSALGTALGGPAGGAIGSQLGKSGGGGGGGLPLAIGAVQGISSIISKRKAEGLEPSLVDVEQQKSLAEVRRKKKAFETGVAARPFLAPVSRQLSQATAAAVRTGAGLRGITRAQRVAGARSTDIIAQLKQQEFQLAAREDAKLNRQERRALDLTRVQQSKLEGRAARQGQAAQANIIEGILSAAGRKKQNQTARPTDVAIPFEQR